MQAVMKVAKGVGNIEICEIAEPIPAKGQVKLKVHATGLSESDVHIYYDQFECSPPLVLGHEIAGEVVEVGEGVSDSLLGARVTPESFYQINHPCTTDDNINLYQDRQFIGITVDGGFSEFMIVPSQNLHRIPEYTSYREGALTEPLACAVHSILLRSSTVRSGDLAVVAGCGTMGLLTLQILKAGYATVVMIGTDEDAHRLAVAQNLGADYVVNTKTRDIRTLVQDVSIQGLGADVVYECSGSESAPQQLLHLVRTRGRYVQMGRLAQSINWDMNQVSSKQLIVTGSLTPTSESWIRAIRLMKSGAVKMAPLLTHDFRLSQWEQAFNTVEHKLGIKALFRPHYEKI